MEKKVIRGKLIPTPMQMGVTEHSGARSLPVQAGVKTRRRQDQRSRVSLR